MRFAAVIYTDDVATVLDFYNRAFGLATRFYDATFDYGELNVEGATLGVASHPLGEMLMPGAYHPAQEAGAGRAPPIEIAFIVDDVAALFERAKAAGAESIAEPKRMPWGATVAYLRSPEGTLVGLSTPVGDSAGP
jgi:predicted enzyme related to lactoylglutathione lyase